MLRSCLAEHAALVVETLEIVKVGDEHIVALMHRGNGVPPTPSFLFATDQAKVVASVSPLSGEGISASSA